MTNPTRTDLTCPHCGSTFEVPAVQLPWRQDERPPEERFVRHCQLRHDLDEGEAAALLPRVA